MPTDWRSYLSDYHQQHAGITETLLERATSQDGSTPYQDLVDQVPDAPGDVLDLACGSAPLAAALTRRGSYVGLDRSQAELDAARTKLPGLRLVVGDGLALPIVDQSVDVVVCSMALMLLQPLGDAVAEIGRVLRPGGLLVAMYPGGGLPRVGEMPYVAAIFGGLLRAPEFPQTLSEARLVAAFTGTGMWVTSLEPKRYSIAVDTAEHADQLIDGLYLPGVPSSRVQRTRRILRAITRRGATVPLHLVHCTAVKSASRTTDDTNRAMFRKL